MYCRQTFEAMLDVNSPVKPFSFAYDGKPCDLSAVRPTVEAGRDGRRKMVYDVVPGQVRLILDMIVWPDFPVIEYTPYFENVGSTDSGILSDISVLDYEAEDPIVFGEQKLKRDCFFGNSRITVRYHLGAKAAGSDFLPQTRDLFARPGLDRLLLDSSDSRCSTDFLPFFAVDNDLQNGLDIAVGWSCAWRFSVEKKIDNASLGTGRTSRIRCGMKRAAFRLHPGEKVLQPGILLHFREGKSIREGQNEFRRFMIAHHAPRNSRGELLKPPVAFAVWGGLETKKQLQRISVIKEKQLPYEELWIDAGWMGSPGPCPHFLEDSEVQSDWPSRVGSWEFNTWAHPEGLRPIADAAHAAGLRLLVWFESLRVHSESGAAVLREHPEWLFADPAAKQGKPTSYLFNIGIPEARKYLFDIISGIMEREGIDDYREDFNMDPGPYFAAADAPDRIGVAEMKFVEGFYRFWAELRTRFPDMFIDNCASGGRRLDYKAATFSFPMCQSDFGCFLPYEEECVQLENRYLDDWLPLHGTLNWGEEDPYHAMCGMGGGYGSKIWQFDGREPKPDHDYARHRKLLEWGKELRDLHMTGDVYPLTEAPERDFTQWNGQQVHDPAAGRGMIQIFRRKRSTEPEFRLALCGLDPDARYEAEFFTGEKRTLSGRELAGLTVRLENPRSFQLIRYRRTK